MKKILFILSLLIILSFNITVSAYQNEPNGFRGLEWGSTIEQFKAKYPYAISFLPNEIDEANNTVSYAVFPHNDSISNVPITGIIRYTFWENQLQSIQIPINEEDINSSIKNFEDMRYALRLLYGEPKGGPIAGSKTDNSSTWSLFYHWEGNITNINFAAMFYDKGPTSSYINLMLYSNEISIAQARSEINQRQKEARQGW